MRFVGQRRGQGAGGVGALPAHGGQPRGGHLRGAAEEHAAVRALPARLRDLRPLLGPQPAAAGALRQPAPAAVPAALRARGGAGRRREAGAWAALATGGSDW